jgi:hypothetical protein
MSSKNINPTFPIRTPEHTLSTPEYTPSALQRFVYEIILIICAQSSKMTAIAQIVILPRHIACIFSAQVLASLLNLRSAQSKWHSCLQPPHRGTLQPRRGTLLVSIDWDILGFQGLPRGTYSPETLRKVRTSFWCRRVAPKWKWHQKVAWFLPLGVSSIFVKLVGCGYFVAPRCLFWSSKVIMTNSNASDIFPQKITIWV